VGRNKKFHNTKIYLEPISPVRVAANQDPGGNHVADPCLNSSDFCYHIEYSRLMALRINSDVCSSVHDPARNDVGGQRRAVSIPAISADWPAMVGHHANVGDSRLDFHVQCPAVCCAMILEIQPTNRDRS
jgi:hypothetical protein